MLRYGGRPEANGEAWGSLHLKEDSEWSKLIEEVILYGPKWIESYWLKDQRPKKNHDKLLENTDLENFAKINERNCYSSDEAVWTKSVLSVALLKV